MNRLALDDGQKVAVEPTRQPRRYFGSDKMQEQQQQQQQTAAIQNKQQNNNNNNNNNKKKKKRKHSFDSIFSFDSELDEFDTQTVRFKPESLDNLVKLTRFNKRELKLMYRGFKQLCPSGVVKEDKFKLIYAQFFPRGAETNGYARFVFNSFDVQRKQEITFTDFVIGLSVLTRGTIDEQLRWIFTLYDLNGDGIITRDELNKIVSSVHDLMGRFAFNSQAAVASQQQQQRQANESSSRATFECELASGKQQQPSSRPSSASRADSQQRQLSQQSNLGQAPTSALTSEEQAENLFRKFDLNNDGMITLDEFIEACHKDENIIKSISVFNTVL